MVGTTHFDFTGESAIVTGSTDGIGRGIAEGLAEAGANVAINARTQADVRETVEAFDERFEGSFVGVAADVRQPDAIEELVATAVNAFGEIDLLVNNAAVWPDEASMIDATLDDWDRTMDVNVRAQFYASQLVAEHMLTADVEGSIINISSQTGDRRSGARGLYGVSNTAVNGLTWKLAVEYADAGIRVNAISTDMTRSFRLRSEAAAVAEGDPERTTDDVLDAWGEQRPLGRLGRPADIADAVCFLASDAADYVVGDILRVSGGGNLQG